ncbi:MAG: hypothetical protein ACR2OA_16360 [Rubripirellula sp.]
MSTFAQPEIVELLKTKFVPVAVDQACQRRQKDAEGVLYRRIAGQGPRSDFQNTTQGFYIASPAGKLLLYNNNRDPQKLLRLMRESLREYGLGTFSFDRDQVQAEIDASANGEQDARYTLHPPEGGLVVRVHAKVLDGYKTPASKDAAVFQTAISRDNLWITPEEKGELIAGRVPAKLQRRIARFHLVDNTRGEPPMWKVGEIKSVDLEIDKGKFVGSVHLQTDDGSRGYQADLRGQIKVVGDDITAFELVALGKFFGEGTYTRNAPAGKFSLAVAFQLADGTDVADAVAPQGARGWLDGYLK